MKTVVLLLLLVALPLAAAKKSNAAQVRETGPAWSITFAGTLLTPSTRDKFRKSHAELRARLVQVETDVKDFRFWMERARAEAGAGNDYRAAEFREKARAIKEWYDYTRWHARFVEK